MSLEIRERAGGVSFRVRVVPRARADGVAGVEGDTLVVRLAAPPVEGKANQALKEFLAGRLKVSRRQVEILAGERSRHKTVAVSGVSAAAVRALAEGPVGRRKP